MLLFPVRTFLLVLVSAFVHDVKFSKDINSEFPLIAPTKTFEGGFLEVESSIFELNITYNKLHIHQQKHIHESNHLVR